MEFNIEKIKRKTLIKYPFFGSIIANINYKENKEILTAATDGKTIYYNTNYLEKLNTEQQIFILAHEICHIAFNHISRSKGKKPKIWNIATDAVINQYLKQDGLTAVEGIVDIIEALNYNSEQLYEKLLQDKDIINQETGHDNHHIWHQEINDTEENESLESKQKELEKIGERETFNQNRKEKLKQLENLKNHVISEATQAKKEIKLNIRKDNNETIPKTLIPWQYILKRTIKQDLDWTYNNATIENGIIVPKLEEQPLPETEIVLDTSCSVNAKILKAFLIECKNILNQTHLKVGCFDQSFYGFKKIETEEDIENMEFIGGKGTDFNVAVKAFERQTPNKIIFTDGKAPMPDITLDILWIVFGAEKICPKGGKVIHITPEQLEKLYVIQETQKTKAKTIKKVIK